MIDLKIAIGLSGGVDSAAAAYLLKKAGNDVLGIIMRLKPGEGADDDIADARLVADSLGIELAVLDNRNEFKSGVIDYFVSEYQNGRTPNPCVECNRLFKFGTMLDFALSQGCDRLATGHYARVEESDGRFFLKKSESPKDQSYFLWRLNQNMLSKVCFPIDSLEKEDTRRIALEAGIPVAEKKDSLEICFVPDDDYISYLASLGVSAPQGNIVGIDGKILGRHNGIINYTVGQRKGLGAYGKPMFVTGINKADNTVIIGENGTQYSMGLTADNVNFISSEKPKEPFRADVKIRYRAKPVPCTVIPTDEGFTVNFDEPQRSVTPGQSVVLYDNDVVIGGGRIISQLREVKKW